MQNPFTGTDSRTFDPMMAPEISDEARKAMKEASDAMSAWRADIIKSSEKYGEQVIDKMAAAAKALGWPDQTVDATRAQLQGIAKMQVQTMDHIMDVWEDQIKSPNPMANSPLAMLSKLKSLPSVSSVGTWPNVGASQAAMVNPMQLWMQVAEQWQKGWTDAMAFWAKAGKPYEGVGQRRY
jgi:hypothetical protein